MPKGKKGLIKHISNTKLAILDVYNVILKVYQSHLHLTMSVGVKKTELKNTVNLLVNNLQPVCYCKFVSFRKLSLILMNVVMTTSL